MKSYNHFTIEPEEYVQYKENFTDFPELPGNDSIIMGTSVSDPDAEEEWLMALLIAAVSVADEKVAHVTYVWRRRQDSVEDIFAEMLPAFLEELKRRGIKQILARTVTIDGKEYGVLTPKILKTAGFTGPGTYGISGGYYLADFYDSLFMRTQAIRASQDEHLLSFASCTEEECRKYLKELRKDTEDAGFSFISHMPFNYFYINDNKPLGVMAIEHIGRNSCILDGAFIKDGLGGAKIFRALLAGVLSGALEGEGMQSRLYIRFADPGYQRLIEECFDEWSINAEIADYKYIFK